jgi:hypothetical protein
MDRPKLTDLFRLVLPLRLVIFRADSAWIESLHLVIFRADSAWIDAECMVRT